MRDRPTSLIFCATFIVAALLLSSCSSDGEHRPPDATGEYEVVCLDGIQYCQSESHKSGQLAPKIKTDGTAELCKPQSQ